MFSMLFLKPKRYLYAVLNINNISSENYIKNWQEKPRRCKIIRRIGYLHLSLIHFEFSELPHQFIFADYMRQ